MTREPEGAGPGGAGRAWLLAAGLVLLVAGALRFHDLGGRPAAYDEARAALNAWGTLPELIERTREDNSSPILYPLLLRVVQKIEISAVSVRLLPAVGSLFTVAVLLFGLPRAGVPRRAAFLAGTLAAFSWAAIHEAQGAREYSLDALVAAVGIVGLLRLLREGRGGAWWGVSLFLGPLVQYGLVLFGAALLLTALAMGGGGNPRRVRTIGRRLLPLRWPAAAFAVGCALSYETTLRHQVRTLEALEGTRFWYLWTGYFEGDFGDFAGVAGFLGSRVVEFSNHWLAPPLGLLTLAAGLVLFLGRVAGARSSDGEGAPAGAEAGSPLSGVLTLLAVSVAVAVAAALAGIYPLVGGRQSTYLAPVLFTGAGVLLAAATDTVRALVGRVAAAACFAALVGAAAWASLAAAPRPAPRAANVARALVTQAGPGDFVYVGPVRGMQRVQRDFQFAEYGLDSPREWPANWLDAKWTPCVRGTACVGRAIAGALSLPNPPGDLFVAAKWVRRSSLRRHLRFRDDRTRLDLVAEGFYGLYRIPDAGPMLARVEERQRARLRAVASGAWGEPTIRSRFDLYEREGALFYHRAPCSPADPEPRFFLHLRGGAPGFQNRDFDFAEFGLRVDGACLASVPLPAGGASALSTGQWIRGGPELWRADLPLGEDFHRAAMDSVASGERGARLGPGRPGRFDLYRDSGDLLLYSPRCTEEAVAPPFVVSFYPQRPGDLPPDRRRAGYEEFEFSFGDSGAVLDGRCLTRLPLPEYPIGRLRVGQVTTAGTSLWSAEYSPE